MGYKSDDWSNATGELSDMPAHLRQNVSLEGRDRAAYPYVLTVTLVFGVVDEDGMPGNAAELDAADGAEEAIADRFEADHGALFGMAITSDGGRDLFLFLPKELSEAEIEHAIDAEDLPLDYDFAVEKDPDWQAYSYLSEVTGD